MFYVVSDEFLSAHGSDNSVHAGFRWRSRREVVNWLTSMLSKQHRQGDYPMSPKDDPISEVNAQKTHMPPHKGRLARNLKGHHLDISWSGSAWALWDFPSFTLYLIAQNFLGVDNYLVQSFVFVMAEKENRYIAYLEDMYEDRKCQKKVKVRWFHHNKEVKGVVSLRNPHPKEVFITPYVQVISAECVDGPAIVLTREHYEKCLAVFPHDLLGGVHFCFRQFKSNRIKPFKLSKLRGEPNFVKHDEGNLRHTLLFALNEKVEFLLSRQWHRGCWFRCTVLEVSRRQMKILYDDVKDEESCTNLEEWVPTYRLAKADKLGMRHDAWWNDGWWEGVVSGTSDGKNGIYQIYIPGENLYLNVELKNLRVSRDWIGDRWVDVEPNPNILHVLSATSMDTKLAVSSAVSKEAKSDNSPTSCLKVVTSHKLSAVEEENDDLAGMTLTNVPLKDDCTSSEQQRLLEADEKDYYSNHDDDEEENADCDLGGANVVKGSVLDGNGGGDEETTLMMATGITTWSNVRLLS
ncbi:UNVERIFIED_CONTAM: protein AGENET DOMAIN (AGD)-CONTAINING P1 [Sesamum angustifolium]|uniref:Protein AGENET DOMAIN (AGD)-CONTAINING P1 n=1 Tax=Sesamum angustifolium TaxID=2727405 RepID=A0AAW2PC98_9LAMI